MIAKKVYCMASMPWEGKLWFALIHYAAVLTALFLVGIALLLDARARRVSNLIQLTQEHRRLWERMYKKPELTRILDPEADVATTPITIEEEMFVVFLILHLSSTYYAMRSGFFQRLQGLRKDIERFFGLPIPRSVWEKMKELQDKKFVSFVESCLPKASSFPG